MIRLLVAAVTTIAAVLCCVCPSTLADSSSTVELEAIVVFNSMDGRLLNAGEPWANARIEVYSGWNYARSYRPEKRYGFVKEVSADRAGRFRLGRLEPGFYHLALFDGAVWKAATAIQVYQDPRPMHTAMLIDYRGTMESGTILWQATTWIPNQFLREGK